MAYTAIDDPEAYFQAKIYTGNGSSSHAITLDGDTNMSPNLVWMKSRSHAEDNVIFDSVRGGTARLYTNGSHAEGTNDAINSFDSDGFNLNTYSSVNYNTYTYVAWCWKESATSGFDIVTYTGDGNASRTIAHSLSAVPHVMLFKERSEARDWAVYHHKNTSAPETDFLILNTTAATADDDGFMDDTAPTSSVFTVDTFSEVNKADQTYVNYIFSEKQGFSKFGSYTGNGNADGPFVYTGFRPAMIIIKATATTDNWTTYDNKSPGYNSGNYFLFPNLSNAEDTSNSTWIDILSNGFKPLITSSTLNTSGNQYIYMAFAEAPFVNSKGVPCNAR